MTREQAYLNEVRAVVAEHGHAIQAVFGDHPTEIFAYTVGLTAQARPELWLGSLSIRQCHAILNDLVRSEPPGAFRHGAALGGARWAIKFRVRGPVDTSEVPVAVAWRLYSDLPVSCLQVLWPDPAGLYPGDDGYDSERFPQRLLPLAVEVV